MRVFNGGPKAFISAPALLAGAAAFAVFVGLGAWQLGRADEKQRMFEAFDQRRADAPLHLGAEVLPPEELEYRRVVVTGRYLSSRHVLRDNRIHHSEAGYHVLTPLLLADGSAVLVNRGWLPMGPDRSRLPATDTPEGERTVTGIVALPDRRAIVIGPEEAHGGSWPRVVQRIDFEALSAALGVALRPYTVRLDPEQAAGFVRDWRPYYGVGPENHRAYALQWFSFAFFLVILALARVWRSHGRPGTDGDGES